MSAAQSGGTARDVALTGRPEDVARVWRAYAHDLEDALRAVIECPNQDAPFHTSVGCNWCSAAPIREATELLRGKPA